MTIILRPKTHLIAMVMLGSVAQSAFASCPYSPPSAASTEVPSVCEVPETDLNSLLANNSIRQCETVCVQTVEESHDDQITSLRVIATNNLTISANISLSTTVSNITPAPTETTKTTLAAGKSYYVYQGNVITTGVNSSIDVDYQITPGTIDAVHNDNFVYELPWETGKTFLSLNSNADYFEFALPVNTAVLAARGGLVVGVKDQEDSRGSDDNSANELLVEHDDQTIGVYRNLAQNGALVNVGDNIIQGQRIAISGQTGFAVNPKLTFYVTRPTSDERSELIDINFLTSTSVESYFTAFEGYTAVHESTTIDPDLSFENDSEIDPNGNVSEADNPNLSDNNDETDSNDSNGSGSNDSSDSDGGSDSNSGTETNTESPDSEDTNPGDNTSNDNTSEDAAAPISQSGGGGPFAPLLLVLVALSVFILRPR